MGEFDVEGNKEKVQRRLEKIEKQVGSRFSISSNIIPLLSLIRATQANASGFGTGSMPLGEAVKIN